MKYTETYNNIEIIESQIKEWHTKHFEYEQNKKDEINSLTNTITSNWNTIENILISLELKEKEITYSKQIKEKKVQTLTENITSIQLQIEKLKESSNEVNKQKIKTCNDDIIALKHSLERYTKQIKQIQRHNKRILNKDRELKERRQMSEEEWLSCQNWLITLTSKIESHSEFIKKLCKSKNSLTTSWEELNEITPQNKDLMRIQTDKLGEMWYGYCNEYLRFSKKETEFIQNVSKLSNFEEVITYINDNSKYQLPHNLCEYLLIALCRIMSYENILDIRMKFVNEMMEPSEEEDAWNEKHKKMKRNNKDMLKKISKIESKIQINQEELTKRGELLNKVNKENEENNAIIKEMENDLKCMFEYRESIIQEVSDNEKYLMNKQKTSIAEINKLKAINEDITGKLAIAKKCWMEYEIKYSNEINAINKVKSWIIQSNTKSVRHVLSNWNTNSDFLNTYSANENSCVSQGTNSDKEPEFKYPSTMTENEFLLTHRIAGLFTKIAILKREITNIKSGNYEIYAPVLRNKIRSPLDYGFKQYEMYLNKSLTKLYFKKIMHADHTIDISPSSLSRVEIPVCTKTLIFVKKVQKNLIKKLNITTKDGIDSYYDNNKDNIRELYKTEPFDDKIFDREYRDKLIEIKKYIMYWYCKPNDDIKIEIIFDDSENFKHWLNGWTQWISDYAYTKEIIDKYIVN